MEKATEGNAVVRERLNQFVNRLYAKGGAMVFSQMPAPESANTALLLIDIQQMLTSKHFRNIIGSMGYDVQDFELILQLLDAEVKQTVGNIEKLLQVCRKYGIQPIHIKIESALENGRDVSHFHKRAGMIYPPNHPEAAILDPVLPADGEIVLTKTCSGIHVGTNIDRLLRNMGIKTVIVSGFYTSECISASVRDLADLGYDVLLPVDAVGDSSTERHQNALQSLANVYAYSETVDSLIEKIKMANEK